MSKTFLTGSDMAAFDYRQAEEIRDAFARHGCRYLFIGKSGAILLGFPDTTQDADLFVEKSERNGELLVAALRETSVLFAAVIGSRLLRERLTWLHWAGVAAVAAGIAATRIG